MTAYNPSVPYVRELKLSPGTLIRVDGSPLPDAQCLAINFQQGPGLNPRSPILFHLAAVFGGPNGEGARVVRNHLVGVHWGAEESSGPTPFVRGKQFSVHLLVEETQYKIAVNGVHCYEFQHRLPYDSCTHLVIDGDLRLNLVEVTRQSDFIADTEPSAPLENPGFAPPGGGLYPSLDNMSGPYGDNNKYPPQHYGGPAPVYPPSVGGATPYPPAPYPYPSPGAVPGYGYPPPPYTDTPTYPPPPPQPAYHPGGPPMAPAYPPGTAGPYHQPQPGYPTMPAGGGYGQGYPGYPGGPAAPPAPQPAQSGGSGGPLGSLGAALGAGGAAAALGSAVSNIIGGKKHKHHIPGMPSSGHSSSGPGLGTALGVGAGALAAGALLKHMNPFKKVKKIFDYSSSSDSD